ncbi:MAG: hypothetical protein E7500_01565 [Ruminococcus sp.]|nr:hypothetical protein [Ruminococcus sp.]
MFCKNCGNELVDDYCSKCNKQYNSTRKKYKYLFVGVIVIVILIFIIKLVSLTKNHQVSNEKKNVKAEISNEIQTEAIEVSTKSPEVRVDDDFKLYEQERIGTIRFDNGFLSTNVYEDSVNDIYYDTISWGEDVEILGRDEGACYISYGYKKIGYVPESYVFEWVESNYYMAMYYLKKYGYEIYDLGDAIELNHNEAKNINNFFVDASYSYHCDNEGKIDSIGIMPGYEVIDGLVVGDFTYSDIQDRFEFGYNSPFYDVDTQVYKEIVYVYHGNAPYKIEFYFAEPYSESICFFTFIKRMEC